MTDNTGDKASAKPPSGGRRHGPTIDLKAKEVASEPVTGGPQATGDAAAMSEAAKPETPRSTADAGNDVPPKDLDPSGPAFRDRLSGLPWTLIGTASAAAVVFFLLGLGAANFFASSDIASDTRPEATQASDALGERLAKLETVLAAPPAPDATLLARITSAEAAAKLAAETATAQQRRADELAALLRETRSRADAAAASADAVQKETAAAADAARPDVEPLLQRIAALEQALKSNEAELMRRAESAADERKNRIAVIASVLLAAVERGSPFAAELAAAKSLAPDAALAPLEPFAASGLPASAELSRELSALIPAMLKLTQSDASRAGGFLDKLQANAERLVRIRPVGEVAGDRPVDVISRIEAKADASDVSGALAELSRLPEQVRAPADGWIAKMNARSAALTAARQFSTNALAAIGKPNT